MGKNALVVSEGEAPEPNPIEAPAVTRASEVDRFVLCRFYGQCLDFAVSCAWASFSCASCEAFEFEHPEDETWWQEQAEKSRALIYSAGIFPDSLLESIHRPRTR